MSASPYASDAKIAEALTVTSLSGVPYTEQGLLQGIATAFAEAGGQTATVALGGDNLAPNEQTLLQQIFVIASTSP